MLSVFEFSSQLKKLNNQNKPLETLCCFKENKSNFQILEIRNSKYIVYEVISALIQTNQYEAIFKFINIFQVKLDPKSFSYLLKKFKVKASVNWTAVIRFCDLINIEALDKDCHEMEVQRKGVTKNMELASNLEDWYAFKTKALFETQQYDLCFNLSKVALESLKKFHYFNEIWFSRRMALSKKNLGKPVEALNELLAILKIKNEWFIQSEIASIYEDLQEFDKALKYAIEGLNNFGDIEYKVGLLGLTGELLIKNNEMELAYKHFLLSKKIREQKGYKIPNKLFSQLSQFKKQDDEKTGINRLKSDLSSYWSTITKPVRAKKKFSAKDAESKKGEVVKILHNDQKGLDGFIGYEKTKSIYFRLNFGSKLIENIKVETKLLFKIIPENLKSKEKAVILKLI